MCSRCPPPSPTNTPPAVDPARLAAPSTAEQPGPRGFRRSPTRRADRPQTATSGRTARHWCSLLTSATHEGRLPLRPRQRTAGQLGDHHGCCCAILPLLRPLPPPEAERWLTGFAPAATLVTEGNRHRSPDRRRISATVVPPSVIGR